MMSKIYNRYTPRASLGRYDRKEICRLLPQVKTIAEFLRRPSQPLKRRRCEQFKAREDSPRAHTNAYVTEGYRTATLKCDAYTLFYFTVRGARAADNCFIPSPFSKATSTIILLPTPRTPTIVPTPNFACCTRIPIWNTDKSLFPAAGLVSLFTLP